MVSNVAEISVIQEPIALVVDVDGSVKGYPLEDITLSGLVLEDTNAVVISNSLVEMQLCSQSKLFTYTFVRMF